MNANATFVTEIGRISNELTGHAMNGNDPVAMSELAIEGITTLATLLGTLGGGQVAPAKRGRPAKVASDEAVSEDTPKRGRPKGSGNKSAKADKPKAKNKATATSTPVEGDDPDEFIAQVVAQALENGEVPSWGRGRPSELKIRAKEAAEKALRKQAREAKKAGGGSSSKKSGSKSGSKSKGKNKGGKNKCTLPA